MVAFHFYSFLHGLPIRSTLLTMSASVIKLVIIISACVLILPMIVAELYMGFAHQSACCNTPDIFCDANGVSNYTMGQNGLRPPYGTYSTKGVGMGLANWLLGQGFASLIALVLIVALTAALTAESLITGVVITIVYVLFELSWLIYGAVILGSSEACKEYTLPLWQTGMAAVILGFISMFLNCGGTASNRS